MRNCYKRDDVFVCRHESHRGFDHRVSAYHVLIEKRCHPDGCLEFQWKCKLLGKGGTCPKDYRHVGSNCTNCRHYYEEKLQRRPEVLLSEREFGLFLEDCHDFDDWLSARRHRVIEVGGEITDVRPYLVMERDERRSGLALHGFLLRLHPGYVGLDGFDEPLYVRINRGQQQRHKLAPGDRIECEGEIDLDRGRIVATRVRRLSVEQRSGRPAASWDRALLDRTGAVTLADQPERCLRCERGALVDVQVRGEGGAGRKLVCLEGIGRPQDCPYEALQAMGSWRCRTVMNGATRSRPLRS